MPKKIGFNPNCRKCQYRSGHYSINICDYCYLTGKPRGCPIENCTKFVPGPRLERPRNITIEPVKEEDRLVNTYVAETKRRNGVQMDPAKDYSKRREG